MNTPTPETDAQHLQFAMGGFTLDFCCKLERERDQLRRWTSVNGVIELQRERDEARKDAIFWQSLAEGRSGTDNDDAGKAMAKLIRQRDEARVNFEAEKERAETNADAFWKAQQQLAAIAEVLQSPTKVEADMIRGKIAIPDRPEFDHIAQIKVLIEERDDAREELAGIEDKMRVELGGHPNSKLCPSAPCSRSSDDLLDSLDAWIEDALEGSKPIGITLDRARVAITDGRDRIGELFDALEYQNKEVKKLRERLKPKNLADSQDQARP